MTTDKAYRALTKMSGHDDLDLLLNILTKVMTPEEASFLLELPAENNVLAAKFNLDEETVKNKIDELMRRGLVVPSRRGVRFPNNLAFVHEAMLSSAPQYIPAELPGLRKELYEKVWRDEIGDAFKGMEAPSLRVIPAQKAVPADVELLPWEDVKAIVEFAKSRAVRNCACRVMVRDCDVPLYNCMQFNRRAEYAINRGSGQELTEEEMLKGCLAAEDDGLVPMVGNIGLMDRMDYICYCCSCCCTGLDPLKRAGNISAGFAKSRFLAEVDQELCNGCQICVERCHFDAIEINKASDSETLKTTIDSEQCYGCGLCVRTCEAKALTLKLVRPREHIPRANQAVIP